MYKNSSKKLLVVWVVATLVVALVVGLGVGVVSADEPVEPTVGEGTTCRRSDCPCGASWGNCQEDPWICWCLCDPCDAERSGDLGYVFATHNRWGISYGRSVLGQAQVGFWGPSPEYYREYRGWATFPLGGLPDQGVAVATVVLDAGTQWLATDENTSLVVELIDIGSWQPRSYYELDYPPTVAVLLRLTTWEVKELVEYYDEPLQFNVPPALLEEWAGEYFTVRLRFEGAPANNLLDVGNAKLYIKWAD